VHHGGVLSVDQRLNLAGGRLDDPGMAVAGAGDPDARGEVEVAAVILVEAPLIDARRRG